MARSKRVTEEAVAAREERPAAATVSRAKRLVLRGAATLAVAGRPEKFIKGVPADVADDELRKRLLASGLFEEVE